VAFQRRLPHQQRGGGRAPVGVPGATAADDRRRRPPAGEAVVAPVMALPRRRRAALLSPLLLSSFIIRVQQLYMLRTWSFICRTSVGRSRYYQCKRLSQKKKRVRGYPKMRRGFRSEHQVNNSHTCTRSRSNSTKMLTYNT